MLKYGIITEVNADKGTVRVKFLQEDIVSNPLQVVVSGTKNNKFSIPYSINEQVACMMDENLEFGVVLGAVYDSKNRPPDTASAQSIDIIIGANKLQIKIDAQGGNLTLEVAGNVDVKCNNATIDATTTTIKGDLDVKGSIDAVGDVKSGTVSLLMHMHTSASSGSPTSPPII